MLNRILVLAVCMFLFSAGWIFGQQSRFAHNGQGWKALGEIDRLLYVNGFENGYNDAVRDIAGLTATWSLEQTKKFLGYDVGTPMIPGVPQVSGRGPLPVPDVRTLSRRVAAAQAQGQEALLTIGQTTEAVSNVYMDFRNMPICWNDAIVLANESLAGYLPPPSDEELALVRAWDTRLGCQ